MKTPLYFGVNYLKNELKTLISPKYIAADFFAGLTVASIAIPLSLAIAMASDVPPGVGLISAIVGGIVAALLGGTRLAVTGPAAAMAVLIASVVETYGLSGLLVIGLICGFLQIICGVFQLGRYAKLVPLPVISAFTAGIGFIIFIGQLPKALQLPAPDQNHVLNVIVHIGTYIETMNPMAFVLALITLGVIKLLPKWLPKAPAPLIAVAIPTLLVYFFHIQNIKLVGNIPHDLPLPKIPDFSGITNWGNLIISSITVFILASLETLLSSSAVDNMGKGDLHNPNQELIGQGAANVAVTFFGGLPVTGVIARSSVNIIAGGKTRRSAIIHSIAVLAAVYIFPSVIEMIPVAALAGILLSSALSMMNLREFIHFWKTDRSESFIYLITFIAIVVTDLVEGVQTGIMIAFLIVAIKMLRGKTNWHIWKNNAVLRVSLTGSMTFWSFSRLSKLQEYVLEHKGLQFVIIEFSELRGLDSTGASHLIKTAQEIAASGLKVIFHQLINDYHAIIRNVESGDLPFIETMTEAEIKIILEESGITHSAVDVLKHGMQRYLVTFAREHKRLIETLAKGQNPHTLLITCSDSRLNPNNFLSSGLGELFIIRNLGNLIPPSGSKQAFGEIASIEYAITNLGIRNIVVCGHTDCHAIKEVMSDSYYDDSYVAKWLSQIKNEFAKKQPQSITDGVVINLLNQIENLKTYPLIANLFADEKLTISAWVYEVNSAAMLEWDFTQNRLVNLTKH